MSGPGTPKDERRQDWETRPDKPADRNRQMQLPMNLPLIRKRVDEAAAIRDEEEDHLAEKRGEG